MRLNIKPYTVGLLIFLAVVSSTVLISNRHMLATPVKILEKQINSLQNQVKILMSKLIGTYAEDTMSPMLANLEPEHITKTSAIITWQSDELSDSFVTYSENYINRNQEINVFVATAINPAWVYFHEVALQNLKPYTTYYYFVSSTDPSGNISSSNTHTIVTDPNWYKEKKNKIREPKTNAN